MASIRLPQEFGSLTKTSSTTLQLAASRINIGGKQYVNGSALSLSISVVGVGGLESAVSASTYYYVYAILTNGGLALVASTLDNPSNTRVPVGAFRTNSTSTIDKSFSRYDYIYT